MKQAVCRRLFRSCKPNDTVRTGSIMADNQSQEMHLETLLRIQKRGVNVRAVDVAAELGYSKPSVSRAVGVYEKERLHSCSLGRSYRAYRTGTGESRKRFIST